MAKPRHLEIPQGAVYIPPPSPPLPLDPLRLPSYGFEFRWDHADLGCVQALIDRQLKDLEAFANELRERVTELEAKIGK
jgi:hypothetical protein